MAHNRFVKRSGTCCVHFLLTFIAAALLPQTLFTCSCQALLGAYGNGAGQLGLPCRALPDLFIRPCHAPSVYVSVLVSELL